MAPQNIVSRGIAVIGRIAAAVGAVAAIFAVCLMFAAGSAGSNDCLNVAYQATGDYTPNEQLVPSSVAACERQLARWTAEFAFAATAAGILLVVAVTASLSSKLVRRAQTAVIATSRQRRMSALRRGADAEVTWPASAHRGQTGRVIDTLPSADEFDATVSFDEADAEIYAFRYQELKPVNAAALSGRAGIAESSGGARRLVFV